MPKTIMTIMPEKSEFLELDGKKLEAVYYGASPKEVPTLVFLAPNM